MYIRITYTLEYMYNQMGGEWERPQAEIVFGLL